MTAIDRLLEAFLQITCPDNIRNCALRALTLYMIAGFAPKQFELHHLADHFTAALAATPTSSIPFTPETSPEEAMAHIDIWYVRQNQGLPYNPLTQQELISYIHSLPPEDLLHAWLLGELAHSLGIDARVTQHGKALPYYKRPFRDRALLPDLYWITHIFLLRTNYLHSPMPKFEALALGQELLVNTAWVVEHQLVDLGAEMMFCIQKAEREAELPYYELLGLILDHQQADGTVVDPNIEATTENIAHTTAAALIALLGAKELDLF